MDQEKINKILQDHEEWVVTNGKKGKRANLCNTDLRNTDLRGVDLRGAYLRNTDFRGANLRGVDFRDAYLGGAYFLGADLRDADLRGAILPKGIYAAGGAGSEQRYTYYDAVNDRVICGCWDDDAGNHLDSFKKRIEDVYGENGRTPDMEHYKAYQAVVNYFEACRDAYEV